MSMFDPYLGASDRFDLWSHFVHEHRIRSVAEIGVYRGVFAARLLAACPDVERYLMVDPWRALAQWNKPANTDDATFEAYLEETLRVTEFAAQRRVVLRGTTLEAAARINDESLDFAYIDGDHTLRGIALDLISIYPKIKPGGWIAGDDFCDSIWQHAGHFEPTFVFPFAAYFAEAYGLTVHALPHAQFAMQKCPTGFRFVDYTGRYGDTSVLRQLRRTGTASGVPYGPDPQVGTGLT